MRDNTLMKNRNSDQKVLNGDHSGDLDIDIEDNIKINLLKYVRYVRNLSLSICSI